jgi:hypothetical protein
MSTQMKNFPAGCRAKERKRQMKETKIVATMTEDGDAAVAVDGQADRQVTLAAYAVATIAANNAVHSLTDNSTPESALDAVLDAIRAMYWNEYQTIAKAEGK